MSPFAGLLFALTIAAPPADPYAAPVSGRVVDASTFADAVSPEFEARLAFEAAQNADALRRDGLLSATTTATLADLQWPLRLQPGFAPFGYHGISNFVDHDARFPGYVQDYTCGERTYDDQTGYNHAGTDYFLWPFAWLMMDQGQVAIVAAAPGTIVAKGDGNFDRDCAMGGSSAPNYVNVLQDDGLNAIYLHMRKGSVTELPIGARVAAGDYLGLVGSSGSSTAPHLHFELRDADGNVVDPRHGQCNASPERWAVSQPYEDPHIDTLSTHFAPPNQIACGFSGGETFDDTPNYADVFTPGRPLWIFASYRDQRDGEVTQFRILRPDGSAFAQWTFDLADTGLNEGYFAGTSWNWMRPLPLDAPAGAWQLQATFQGRTYTHEFRVHGRPIRVPDPR